MSARRKAINQNSHQARNSNLSKRIDKKLEYVAETVANAVGSSYLETQSSLFEKRLLFQGLHFVKHLDLKYNFENRLMAISYNLELSNEIKIEDNLKEKGLSIFEVVTKGRLNTKDATWICTVFDGAEEEKEKYLACLNNNLILNRVFALDLQKIRVIHEAGSDVWKIRCESMIGSSTWVLLPPMISFVKPKIEECIQFVEFFELVADALMNHI